MIHIQRSSKTQIVQTRSLALQAQSVLHTSLSRELDMPINSAPLEALPLVHSPLAGSAPCDQALGAQLVLCAGLRPGVRGVDGRVAVHVRAILVSIAVHSEALQRAPNRKPQQAQACHILLCVC